MRNKNALLVDDKTELGNPLLDTLRSVFNVDYRADPASALAEASAGKYGVYFIDLSLVPEEEGTYDGMHLTQRIRDIDRDAVIVIYSSYIKGEPAEFKEYRSCFEAGADDVIARSTLRNKLKGGLEEYVAELYAKRQAEIGIAHAVRFEEDVRSAAALEMIDAETISKIVRALIPNGRISTVQALAGGYSGSVVLAVSTSTADSVPDELHSVIKVDTEHSVEREVRAQPAVGSLLSSVAPQRMPGTCSIDGWSAFGTAYVDNSEPLASRLKSLTDAETTATLAETILNALLVPDANKSVVWDTAKSGNAFEVRAGFVIQVQDALKPIIQATSILSKEDRIAAETIANFVEKCGKGLWGLSGRARLLARLHGDLHSGNILVKNDGSIAVIDFARRDVYPRFFDFAALDTDLILNLYDSQKGRQLDFQRLDDWTELWMQSWPFVSTAGRSKNAAIWKFRQALVARVRQFPHATLSEYADVLLFQMMRYLRFSSISLPRKVLAVRLANRLVSVLGV
jgi:CheY-like chemotaxis protein